MFSERYCLHPCVYVVVIFHTIDCILWPVGLEDEVIYDMALKK